MLDVTTPDRPGRAYRSEHGEHTAMPKITPHLWFDTQAEEAANHYVAIFPNSEVLDVARYGEAGPGPEGSAMTVSFRLDGRDVFALNGGPAHAAFTEAFSFVVTCESQSEVDTYWEKLTDGGEPGQCGWLKDRFGLSWRIVPTALMELLQDPDPERSQRVMRAMLTMTKIDIATLRGARDVAPLTSEHDRFTPVVAIPTEHPLRCVQDGTESFREGRDGNMIQLIRDNQQAIIALCHRYRIRKLEVFGSAATGAFDPATSDIDFVVDLGVYAPGTADRYLDLIAALEDLLGHRVEMITRPSIRNPYLRQAIEAQKVTIHESPDSEAAA